MSQSGKLIRYYSFQILKVNLFFSAFVAVGTFGLGAIANNGNIAVTVKHAAFIAELAGLSTGYAFGCFYFYRFKKHELHMFRTYGLSLVRLSFTSYFLVSSPFILSIVFSILIGLN